MYTITRVRDNMTISAPSIGNCITYGQFVSFLRLYFDIDDPCSIYVKKSRWSCCYKKPTLVSCATIFEVPYSVTFYNFFNQSEQFIIK